MTVYEENGYTNRKEYLLSLVDAYGIEEHVVFSLASLLGKTEDFDGLVNSLDDIQAGDGGFHGGYDGD